MGAGTTATLSGAQKVALAAGSSIAGTAANKLVGNQASFNWRNVATSALTAGVMHRLGLTDPNSPFERFNEGQGIVSGTLSGIAGTAIGYAAGKLIQQSGDRPSWNFNNVAMDAFGNALGNSFVANRVAAEKDRYNAALGVNLTGQHASNAVNDNLNAQFDVDQSQRNAAMDNDLNKLWQQQALSTTTDLNKIQDIENAKRADQTLARIEAVNAQSAALQTHANEMQQHFDASMKYRQESTDFALKEALARGANAAFTGHKRQDLMPGINVESNIAWAIQRREAAYSSVGLGAGAANGSFGDFATWYGASLANESWQALQFMGKAVVNGLTLGTMNDRFSPLSSSYHSLIGDNTLFGNPTTFSGAVGLKSGVYGSYGLDPLAAVGGFGKLAKFDFNLSLNGTPVQRFSGNNGSWGGDYEFGTYIPLNGKGASIIYQSPLGIHGYMPTGATVYGNPLFDFSDAAYVSRNAQIREGYLQGTQDIMRVIDEMQNTGHSAENIARRVVIQRNSQKMESRSLMTPAEVSWLEAMNMNSFYKNPVGPTPDQMFKEYGSWENVIHKTLTKDPAINMLLGLAPGKY